MGTKKVSRDMIEKMNEKDRRDIMTWIREKEVHYRKKV